jgi:diguanylate cyclase (GGDEF)-like protein
MENFFEFLDKQPRKLILNLSLLAVILISILDFITGTEITFSFIYIAPITLTAWVIGRREGIFLSVTSALTWTLANHLFNRAVIGLFVSYWNAGAHLGFFLIVTLLVSELRQLLEKEKTLARTDFLTGALNRRAFNEVANLELLRSIRNQRPLTLIYMDLDDFKAINDLQGHDAGDALLKLVVETLSHNLRPFDSVGRLGGDEFAILMPETSHQAAKRAAPRLQSLLLGKMKEKGYPVTFSIGAPTHLSPPGNIDQMLKMTDALLYRVKQNGKNGIEYAEVSE